MSDTVSFNSRTDLTKIKDALQAIKNEMSKVIVGQEEMIDQVLIALMANGHILLEGVPGVAKTLTAKVLAYCINSDFSRIQFTPDLMPSDITGTSVYNNKKSDFEFKEGPVFSNLVLVDEINRAPAKTQSALLEVMEEKQVTVDGTTYKMNEPFMVLATQNPIEYEGTYRLPEAQIDRFLFKIKVGYPELDEEINILEKQNERKGFDQLKEIKKIIKGKDIVKLKAISQSIHVDEKLQKYIAEIVIKSRNHSDLYLGGSPRASLAIMEGAKAYSILMGRDFVKPDDIQYIAYPALRHRFILTPEKEMEGKTPEDVIKDIIASIEVPR